ncbi:MAG TPA: redoxin domain-containing protein [Candidatus Didemnitutus sp.]|nr:redoxin domain-containing protein [Candidatus Didemnitutus sp.]
MSRPLRCLLLCACLGGLPGGAIAADWWTNLARRDLDGAALSSGPHWIAVVFISPECPVANAEIPVLNDLAAGFSGRGVLIVGAYADPTLDPKDLRRHATEYGLKFPTTDDRDHRLVRLAHATYTPEVCVFDREGKIIYRGRIDDRADGYGAARPKATEEDLREVLSALVAGRPVPFAEKPGFGCSIPGTAER